MLHGYDFSHAATRIVGNAVRARLLDALPQNIVINAEFLDLTRLRRDEDQLRLAQQLQEKYAAAQPDIVMSIGGETLPFVIKHRDTFAPGVPVVFSSVSRSNYLALHPPPDVTGILLDLAINYENTIKLAEILQPQARRLYVIAGTAPIDRRSQQMARAVIESRPRNFQTTYLFGLPYDRLLAEVSRIPADSIVINTTNYADGDGKVLVPGTVAIKLASLSRAPVYSPYSLYLGKGLLGGYSETFESHGIAAADMALQILAGKDPATLPPQVNPAQTFRVDYKAMQHWHLSEQSLPTGTVVIGKEPTIWDQHRGFVVAVLLTIAVLLAFIAALLTQSRRRQAAEAEAALQRREVAHLMRVSVLGELSGAIAHEINQPLTAISTNAHAALDMVPASSPEFTELRETLNDIIAEDHRAGEVIDRLRKLLRKDQKALETINLNELVNSTVGLLKGELLNRGIAIETDLQEGLAAVSGDAVQIQQVLLNLLMNAMDAMASIAPAGRLITVRTRMTPAGNVEVAVRDRGIGIDETSRTRVFDPFYTTKTHGLGLGLSICSTIIQAHGGTLSLMNDEILGAIATFSLPAEDVLIGAK